MTWRKKGGGKGVEVEGLRGGGGWREGERRRRWLRDGEASKLVREEGGGVGKSTYVLLRIIVVSCFSQNGQEDEKGKAENQGS